MQTSSHTGGTCSSAGVQTSSSHTGRVVSAVQQIADALGTIPGPTVPATLPLQGEPISLPQGEDAPPPVPVAAPNTLEQDTLLVQDNYYTCADTLPDTPSPQTPVDGGYVPESPPGEPAELAAGAGDA